MHLGSAATEVTQLPFVVDSKQHILRLDVPMSDCRLLTVHVRQSLDYVGCDENDLWFGEAFASIVRSTLNQVQEVATRADFIQHVDIFVAWVAPFDHMFALFKQSDDVHVLAKLTGGVTLISQVHLWTGVGTSASSSFESKEIVILDPLHLVDVGELSFVDLRNHTILLALKIYHSICQRILNYV